METVTLPREEYNILIKCKHILELETDEDFSLAFLKRIEKARRELAKGKGIKLRNKKEVEAYFKAM